MQFNFVLGFKIVQDYPPPPPPVHRGVYLCIHFTFVPTVVITALLFFFFFKSKGGGKGKLDYASSRLQQ